MLHAQGRGSFQHRIAKPTFADPCKPITVGILGLEQGEHVDEEQWILLGLEAADRQQLDRSPPVSRRRK